MRSVNEVGRDADQLELGIIADRLPRFPSTRYQGSKAKLVDWISEAVSELSCETVLDLFSGTGCVAHMLKRRGKNVTANDALRSNYEIAAALIENDDVTLSESDVHFVTQRHGTIRYPTFIADTFEGIYFTAGENEWLDMAVTNIRQMENRYKRAVAFFALFQACIVKRPFNLFHRRNLNLRTADVRRSFGNKTSWDRPFEEWFRQFVLEANGAVFANGAAGRASNRDWREVDTDFDLVYIDTPYMSKRGVGVDFLDFYHFLEGLTRYDEWPTMLDWKRKHRPIRHDRPVWCDPAEICSEFHAIFQRFRASTLLVSYRSQGIPSVEELMSILGQHKSGRIEIRCRPYQYVLSPQKGEEILLIAE